MSRATLLNEYISRVIVAARPFDWEFNNCCVFVGDWVHKMEGLNPMDGLPRTPSMLAARKLLRTYGTLNDFWTQQLGRVPIPAAYAWVGDVVLIPLPGDDPEAEAVGICNGMTALFLAEDGRVLPQPMTVAKAAWRLEMK